MKNVKTLLIFITISTFIFASGTRVASLGGNAGYWADDYANITNFPGAVNDHSVAWTDGSNFTSVWNTDGTTWGFSGGAANDVINMMWGGGDNGMGVSVGLGMVPDDEATTGVDEAETTYNVGFGMPLAEMDFGFTFDGDDVGVNLRRTQDVPPFWDNILIGFDMTLEDEDAGQAADMGVGVHCYNNRSYENGSSSLFALGFEYDAPGALVGDAPDPTMDLIWTFAVESEMTDWAKLRVGYNRAHDFGGGANADGVVSMGLGFNYDSFTLDMNLNSYDTMLKDPVVYMAGRNADPLGASWTISYIW